MLKTVSRKCAAALMLGSSLVMITQTVAAQTVAAQTVAAQAQDATSETLIHAGQVLAIPGQAPLSNRTLVVQDGKIIGIESGFITRPGAEVIDLKTMFILPGLIDSHVHLASEWSPSVRLDGVTKEAGDIAYDAADHARKTLMAGFTAVQDVGGPKEVFALRRAINTGKLPGPHIKASGPPISATGGHGDVHGYVEDILDLNKSKTICDGADDCRRAVRAAVKSGADVIKITATGGVLSNTNAGTEQQFFDDELAAIVETAKKMGRKVTAHAHGKTGIESALKAGVLSIEHGTYLDPETARLFKQNNATLVPTVLAGMTVVDWATNESFLPPASAKKALEVGPKMQAMLTTAWENGITIAFGTDTGVSKHGDNAQEFQYMIKAGMSEMDAIKAATSVAAKHISMDSDIGTLEAGKFADLIAVDENPLEDINALLDVDFVMKGGKVYKTP